MPKITDKGGPSFDPTKPVDPIEAADPRSPVPDPNAPRERPGEDGTAFAKHQDDDAGEVEYEGRSPEPKPVMPDRPALNASKPEWVEFAQLVNEMVDEPPIEDPTAATKAELIEAYREYGNVVG